MTIDREKFLAAAALLAATTGLTACPAKPEATEDGKAEEAKAEDEKAEDEKAEDEKAEDEDEADAQPLPGDESGGAEPPPAEAPVEPEADGGDDASGTPPAATKETLY